MVDRCPQLVKRFLDAALELPRVDAGDPAHLLVVVLGIEQQERRVHIQFVLPLQVLHVFDARVQKSTHVRFNL